MGSIDFEKSKGVFVNDDKQLRRSTVTVFKFSLLPSYLPSKHWIQNETRNILFLSSVLQKISFI